MNVASSSELSLTVFSGGVGGAKLVRGLAEIHPAENINVITNTADDSEFYGLYVSPDLDTVMYKLSGLSDEQQGWGIKGDTFQTLSQLGLYGAPTWFKLGDRDLATHILRTEMLKRGLTLTQVTDFLSKKLGIRANILPMTDDRVQTFIQSEQGWLSFQEYFVQKQQKVRIKKISFRGIRSARCGERVAEAIATADLIIFAPSNPIVSILPILSLAGVKKLLHDSRALKVAVSPFVNRRAVSGPAKELMEAKGLEGSSSGLARFYARTIDLLFIHHSDRAESGTIEHQGVKPVPCQTIMKGLRGSAGLAGRILETCWEGLEKRA